MDFFFTNVTIDKGPLFVIENSHKFNDIKEKFDGFDVGIDKNRKASIEEHPSEFAKKRNSKILTSNFYPGDILIFGMNLIHGSFEHHSKDNNIRLTCDVRYQPIAEPKDSRYFGKIQVEQLVQDMENLILQDHLMRIGILDENLKTVPSCRNWPNIND